MFHLSRARSSVTFLVAPLCWNVTCKCQTLALVTSLNASQLCADASEKCLSLPQYVKRRLQMEKPFSSLPSLHPHWSVFPEVKSSWPACLFLLAPLCAYVRLTRLCVQMSVWNLRSWANNHCLLYSMTCLKWRAGPKRRRPAEFRINWMPDEGA